MPRPQKKPSLPATLLFRKTPSRRNRAKPSVNRAFKNPIAMVLPYLFIFKLLLGLRGEQKAEARLPARQGCQATALFPHPAQPLCLQSVPALQHIFRRHAHQLH